MKNVKIISVFALGFFLLSASSAVAAAYIKFDGVDGEAKTTVEMEAVLKAREGSTGTTGVEPSRNVEGSVPDEPAEKKGNVEYSWKVEEGTKFEGGGAETGSVRAQTQTQTQTSAGIEPDEIDFMGEEAENQDGDVDRPLVTGEAYNPVSVSAVQVRGWDMEKKQEFLAKVKTHAEVRSEQDLENFAIGILVEDEQVEEISLNFEKIEVNYQSQGKLFGFIPVSLKERVEVETEGENAGQVKVKMPWYSFLVSKAVKSSELETAVQAEVEANLGENDNWDFEARASVLSLVSNILKTKHDTAKNSINNVR